MVPEFLLSACIFLTSREVRLGSLVTFDPSFDPLKMRNEKKRTVLSHATFLRGIQICNQILILTTLKF